MKPVCLYLCLGMGFSAVASAEDLLWEGKIYRDVKVNSADSPDKGDKRMVILSSPSGYVTVPYKRLSWTLQKEADALQDLLDLSPEKMVGRKWVIGRHVRNIPEGIVIQCRAPRGVKVTSKQAARGRVLLRNFTPPSKDFDKENIKVLAWYIGVPSSDDRKNYYPIYDMKPPVLIPEREWTDKKGRKLMAALAASGEKHVVLVRKGKPITLAKDLLSPADVTLIDEQTKKK